MKLSYKSVIDKCEQLSELLRLIEEDKKNAPQLLYDIATEKCNEIAEYLQNNAPDREDTVIDCNKTEENNPAITVTSTKELENDKEHTEILNSENEAGDGIETEVEIEAVVSPQVDKEAENDINLHKTASTADRIENTQTVYTETEKEQAEKPKQEPEKICINKFRQKKIREVISINDLFLFKRELFDNNDATVNKIFSEIDNSQSAEKALKLLQEQFCWDVENNEFAADFLKKVESCFN